MAALLDRALDESGYEAALLGEPLGSRKRANVRKLVRLARRFDRQGGLHARRLRGAASRRPETPAEGGAGRLDGGAGDQRPPDVDSPGQGARIPDRRPARPRPQAAPGPRRRRLRPRPRPARPPLSRDDDPEGEAPESLGWAIHRQSRKRFEEAEEATFASSTSRRPEPRDALILASGSSARRPPARRPPWRLLARRFDRSTGRLVSARFPDGWSGARRWRRRAGPLSRPKARARLRGADLGISAILQQIEDVEPEEPRADVRNSSEASDTEALIDLDPSRRLSPVQSARVDRLHQVDPRPPSTPSVPGRLEGGRDSRAAQRAWSPPRTVARSPGPWRSRRGSPGSADLPKPLGRAKLRSSVPRPGPPAGPPDVEIDVNRLPRAVVDLAWRDTRKGAGTCISMGRCRGLHDGRGTPASAPLGAPSRGRRVSERRGSLAGAHWGPSGGLHRPGRLRRFVRSTTATRADPLGVRRMRG